MTQSREYNLLTSRAQWRRSGAGAGAARVHLCTRPCLVSAFVCPRHFLRGIAATIRATHGFRRYRYRRFAFPPSPRTHYVSFRGGVCNLCAADNPRAGDKSFIAAESRHGTRLLLLLLLPSYSPLVPNRTRLHDEYSGEGGFQPRGNALE